MSEFSRIITLLRKEKGITQKQAAEQLGVSQALLSHYEKGIRECGLDFVVRVADFYGVSCDYLLGRSPDRSGLTLSVEEIPNPETAKDGVFHGSVLPTFNKKLISNSLNILYDKLNSCPDKGLVSEISAYLMIAVYKMFRLLYNAEKRQQLVRCSQKCVLRLCGRGHACGRGQRRSHFVRRGHRHRQLGEGHQRLQHDHRKAVQGIPPVRHQPVQPDQDKRGAHRPQKISKSRLRAAFFHSSVRSSIVS